MIDPTNMIDGAESNRRKFLKTVGAGGLAVSQLDPVLAKSASDAGERVDLLRVDVEHDIEFDTQPERGWRTYTVDSVDDYQISAGALLVRDATPADREALDGDVAVATQNLHSETFQSVANPVRPTAANEFITTGVANLQTRLVSPVDRTFGKSRVKFETAVQGDGVRLSYKNLDAVVEPGEYRTFTLPEKRAAVAVIPDPSNRSRGSVKHTDPDPSENQGRDSRPMQQATITPTLHVSHHPSLDVKINQ